MMDYEHALMIVTDIRTAIKNGEEVTLLGQQGTYLIMGARVKQSSIECLTYRPGRAKLVWDYAGEGATIIVHAAPPCGSQGKVYNL